MRQQHRFIIGILIAPLGVALLAGCGASPDSNAQSATGGVRIAQTTTRKRSRRSNSSPADTGNYNMAAPIVPDPRLTPGDVLDVTKDDFCTSGYSKKVRNVPQAVKEQAYREYGITHREKGEYEVDHLISLELGGSNSIKNLWPESYKTQPLNAHVKDALENRLHELICSGQLDAKVAQQAIARDWVAAYRKYVGPLPTGSGDTSARSSGTRSRGSRSRDTASADDTGSNDQQNSPQSGAASGQVWVNLNSGKYWRPGTRYYGKTKKGQYMREADAIKAGYVAAQGQ